ncbi:hypothetical protein, partial [Staphylococcus epidermidis]|uniref:hypothetical protein n=1 Tax=Staphylococcus epidermidis TaxID=1282 RepID=UPI0037D9CD3A
MHLPLLPHITQDQTLKHPFINPHHIHTPTAIKLFNLQSHHVHTLITPQPKPVNFPILYPITHYPFTHTFAITTKQPKPFIHH